MPLPIWLIPAALKGAAALVGAAGIGTAIHGAKNMKEANDTMEAAKKRHEQNMERYEKKYKITSKDMDKLGALELEILHSFSEFSDVFEKIKNRHNIENYSKNGVTLPKYDGEKLKEVSVGAGVLLGGLSGAGLGAAGSFAATGATQVACAAMMGTTTLGVGLLVGGIIFNFTGRKLSDKADEAWSQMKKAEDKINKICDYLVKLRKTSNEYYSTLTSVNKIYQEHLSGLKSIVNTLGHTDWNTFTPDEKKLTENTVLLVGLLYNMCKVEIVLKGESDNDINKINTVAVEKSINIAKSILADKF